MVVDGFQRAEKTLGLYEIRGYNLGILYRLNERTQLGLAYTSKIDLKFKDSPELKHITNPLLI